jgi:hypothetical protein
MASPQPAKKHKKGFFRRIKLKSIVKGAGKLAGSIAANAGPIGNAASAVSRTLRRSQNFSDAGLSGPAAVQAAIAEEQGQSAVSKIPTVLWVGLGVTVLYFMLKRR